MTAAQMAPARQTLAKFGNTSSSSTWYACATAGLAQGTAGGCCCAPELQRRRCGRRVPSPVSVGSASCMQCCCHCWRGWWCKLRTTKEVCAQVRQLARCWSKLAVSSSADWRCAGMSWQRWSTRGASGAATACGSSSLAVRLPRSLGRRCTHACQPSGQHQGGMFLLAASLKHVCHAGGFKCNSAVSVCVLRPALRQDSAAAPEARMCCRSGWPGAPSSSSATAG